jgi:hypothetical protein
MVTPIFFDIKFYLRVVKYLSEPELAVLIFPSMHPPNKVAGTSALSDLLEFWRARD